MIKKYFALSIIALSVAMVGCSSDDDDDDPVAGGTTAGATTAGGTTAGETTAGGTTDGGTTDGGTTDGGTTDGGTTAGGETTVELTAEATIPEVSAYDFVASSTDHTTLLAALDANPAIANAADDEAAPITLIAPTNAAFDALIAATDSSATADELLANEGALVTRTLQYHAIGSVVDITDTTPATDTLLVDDGTAAQLTFQAGTAETAAAVDSAGTAVDLAVVSEAATGNLYSAASVLVAPDAPVVDGGGTDGGGTDGGGTPAAGSAGMLTSFLAANAAGQDFNNFITITDSIFGDAFDRAVWNLYIPNDTIATAALADADFAGSVSSSGFSDVDFATQASTLTPNSINGVSYTVQDYPVTSDGAGGFTVNGVNAVYLGQIMSDTGEPGAHVYTIDALLPASVVAP